MNNFSYSVAIRTLGKAGDKYLKTLQSCAKQTVKPTNIYVYIPYGYDLPKETIGSEIYIRCEKGMIIQRAQKYEQINDEWILFLDDDIYLPENYIEKILPFIEEAKVDCITADIYDHSSLSFKDKLFGAILSSSIPIKSSKWGFKVLHNGRFAYNIRPIASFMQSQTGAGACILCRKEAILSIQFGEERWLEEFGYALGEDQLFHYKLHINNFKIYTFFASGAIHLDAGSKNRKMDSNQIKKNAACMFLIWYRSIYKLSSNSVLKKFYLGFCFFMYALSQLVFSNIYLLKKVYKAPIATLSGYYMGWKFCQSSQYRKYPLFH